MRQFALWGLMQENFQQKNNIRFLRIQCDSPQEGEVEFYKLLN